MRPYYNTVLSTAVLGNNSESHEELSKVLLWPTDEVKKKICLEKVEKNHKKHEY